jgi:subtilisin family serine protease
MTRSSYRAARVAAGTALILATSFVAIPVGVVAAAGPLSAKQDSAKQSSSQARLVAQHGVARASENVMLLLKAACPVQARTTAGVACPPQAAVLAELKAGGAKVLSTTTLVDSVTALVSPALASTLASSRAISQVVPDTSVNLGTVGSATSSSVTSSSATPSAPTPAVSHVAAPAASTSPGAKPVLHERGRAPASEICGTRSQPELDPEGLADVNANQARSMGIDGSGVTVAVVADGLDPTNPDFVRNAAYGQAGTPVIAQYLDFSGDGTAAATDGAEAFGDASSIVAQGNKSYNLAEYVNPELSSAFPKSGCWVKVVGVAPGASLLVLKVIGNGQGASTSSIVQAVQYAVQHGAKVINESLGSGDFPDTALDVVRDADEAAVAAGVTVVTSSGDAGLTSTIGSPATDPDVISVGATTNFRDYAQSDEGGFYNPAVGNGTWLSNNVAAFSSGGYSQSGGTVDLVAPGDSNWALCSTNPKAYTGCADNFGGKDIGIQSFGGTSEAAPLTAAAAADVIQAYSSTHSGTDPSPALVKDILCSTATDIDAPADEQGAGMLNVLGAVKLAESLPAAVPPTTTTTTTPGAPAATTTTTTATTTSTSTTTTAVAPALRVSPGASRPDASRADASGLRPPSGALLISPNQLNVVGLPGATSSQQVSLTNTGPAAVTVGLSTRALSHKVHDTGVREFTMDPMTPTTNMGAFPIWSGVSEVYQTETFRVPATSDSRLVFDVDYQDTGQNSLLHVALYDPSGTYAGYSDPQGLGDYGEIEVTNPPAGVWTALFFTEQNGALKGGVGTSGTVQWDASTWRYESAAAVSPSSLTIAPGATATAAVSITDPRLAGDTTESVVVSSPGGQTTVPVTVRTTIDVGARGGLFKGVLTGGNGRDGSEAETNTYFFQVPPGETDLNTTIALGTDPNEHLIGFLVSPSGQQLGYSGNYTFVPSGSSAEPKAAYGLVPGATPYVQMYAVAPQAGQWELVLQWTNPVTGNELTEPFSGSIQFNQVQASGRALPSSPKATLAQGQTTFFQVDVANSGVAPEAYFLDPRLDKTATMTLPDLNPRNVADLIELPLGAGLSYPLYLVPTGTTQLDATLLRLAGTGTVSFDMNHTIGDPDVSPLVAAAGVSGSTGTNSQSVSLDAPEVSPGLWALNPQEVGPYPAGGAPKTVALATVSALTQAFDPAVRSDTDDLWQVGLSFTHFRYLGPGQSVAILVAIKPTAPVGTYVQGTLYIDDFTLDSFLSSGDVLPDADELAAVPYSYTVVAPGGPIAP